MKYFQHEKRNFVSPSGHVMFYFLYKHQTISMKQFFPAKGAIYYVAIATVIFSHVKITSYFHVWRYHVFARKLTWYFIGVYIIKGTKFHPAQYRRNSITKNCCSSRLYSGRIKSSTLKTLITLFKLALALKVFKPNFDKSFWWKLFVGRVYLYKKELKTKQITSVSFKHNGTSIRSLP